MQNLLQAYQFIFDVNKKIERFLKDYKKKKKKKKKQVQDFLEF